MTASVAVTRPISWGVIASAALLSVYFGILTLVSGWAFTVREFANFWFYVLPLAAGFGLQVALYTRLKQVISASKDATTVMATTGTTSTAAMISCCAHYLTNLAPILGAAGLVSLAAQYQVEFFWVGLAFNAAGIGYIGTRLFNATKEHAQCVA